MQVLADPEALVALVAEQFDAHPWARICASPRVTFDEAWYDGTAVVWRSGHPWSVGPVLHALGPPAAAGAALAGHAQPGDEAVVARRTHVDPATLGLGPEHRWTLRLRSAACPSQHGEDRVDWLSDDAPTRSAIEHLLDLANPRPAVRPGAAIGGRWCGAYEDGMLVACAAETVLAWPRGHLSSLAVHPEMRRAGLGGAVTAWFVRQSLAGGAPEVLLAVDGGNDGADRLYDRLGFDAWPMSGYYRPPAPG